MARMADRQAAQAGFRIGVDLGGTKIEAAALDAGRRHRAPRRIATPAGDYDATVAAIAGLVAALESEIGARAPVGIGIPGTIVAGTGLVKNANSTWLIGRPLARDVEAALGRPVRFANDANCFALSEATDGAAAGSAPCSASILGTGVGGGIVIGGRLLAGANAIAGEWGHNPLPAPQADEAAGTALLLRPVRLYRDFPVGARPRRRPSAAITGRALSAPQIAAGARAGGPIAARRSSAMPTAGPRARDRHQSARPGRDRARRRAVRARHLYEDVPRRWGRHVFSDTVVTRLLPPLMATPAGCAAPPGCGRRTEPDRPSR